MIKTIKVRLRPTVEQTKKLWQSAGVSRFAYNWAVAYEDNNYKNGENFIDDCELRRIFTGLKQKPEYEWLYETSNNITKQAIKDACAAYKKFFQGKAGKPKFKNRRRSEPRFYNDNIKLKYKDGKFLIEKVGWVRISEPERITDIKFSNPHVTYDGKYWYISVGVEQEVQKPELTGETIGIDLGIKELATVSSIDKPFENINKTKEVGRLKKKLKRKQRQISRKYNKNKKPIGKAGENRYKFTKSKNTEKLESETRLINRRLSNMRLNHIHQATNTIVKTKPSKIVVEDLNVKGMMKNRHLSKAISEQCFNIFIIILTYKCILNGIEIIKADRFYPSSKKCSCCGVIKKDLKLKDRIFLCPECGFSIDRDKNASINLSRYEAA